MVTINARVGTTEEAWAACRAAGYATSEGFSPMLGTVTCGGGDAVAPPPSSPQTIPVVTNGEAPGPFVPPLPPSITPPTTTIPAVVGPVVVVGAVARAIAVLRGKLVTGTITKRSIMAFVKKYKFGLASTLALIGISLVQFDSLEEGKRVSRGVYIPKTITAKGANRLLSAIKRYEKVHKVLHKVRPHRRSSARCPKCHRAACIC